MKISDAADAGTLVSTDKLPIAREDSTTPLAATMAEVSTYMAGTYVSLSGGEITGDLIVDGVITGNSGVGIFASPSEGPGSLLLLDATRVQIGHGTSDLLFNDAGVTIHSVVTPVNPTDAANKAYADAILTADTLAALDLSSLPTADPGGGRLWISNGALRVGP